MVLLDVCPRFINVYFTWTCQIKVSNSALISAFMTELEADTPVTQVCMWSFYWEFYMNFGLFEYFIKYCCFSVIVIDCNYQLVHFWRGMWNFLLSAWMICLRTSRRYILSIPELCSCWEWCFFVSWLISSFSSNTITETCHASKPNNKPGFKREGKKLHSQWTFVESNCACIHKIGLNIVVH